MLPLLASLERRRVSAHVQVEQGYLNAMEVQVSSLPLVVPLLSRGLASAIGFWPRRAMQQSDIVALLVLAYFVIPTRQDACSVLSKDFFARRPLFPCPSLPLVRLSEPAPDYRAPFLSFVFGVGYPPQSLNPLLHLHHCHLHWIN